MSKSDPTPDPKPLSAEERAEAMRLCDAATEGPWEPFAAKWNGRDRFFAQAMYPWPDEDGVRDEFDEIVLEGSVDAGLFFTLEEQIGNIKLAAASRTLIPRYEATVKALEEALRGAIKAARHFDFGSGPIGCWECEHGFPLDKCPNDKCDDRDSYLAIEKGEQILVEGSASDEA